MHGHSRPGEPGGRAKQPTSSSRPSTRTLTYYGFPDIHWQKLRTNNPLERIMKEIRRRTRVVGAFPDGQSCLNLSVARLRYIAGTVGQCYMNMRSLYQHCLKPKPLHLQRVWIEIGWVN
jgi:transposase-like protein